MPLVVTNAGAPAACVIFKAVVPTEALSELVIATNVLVAVLAELEVKLAKLPVVKLFPVADTPVPVSLLYVISNALEVAPPLL